ncbi:hypothetical protein BLA60_31085 [Actinophytocola xinjiangensis]|uniref:PEP-utilising enzyme mobile domain-containing protein n=1 Tax=Actinophytocola xinjiangensis TaxID=485602 RepID=A0A7Z0WGI4_9PSEU|nr:PEP-utilizing enzyme [Actinophytocola xinjiangensis]OLF06703.1 hypothetical protein BLA60_31085 [Actinophytocola xinjiangensis]
MRILISAVTSDLGRAFARAAVASGHDVAGTATHDHDDLDPAVALTIGEPADAEALIPGRDVVVHLVPVERDAPESGGIPVLRKLAAACSRAGVRFVVPLAHGPDVADADRVVRDSGAEHVVVRTAPLGGRMLDWYACRTYATLLSAPRDTSWRLLHTDDLVRFLLLAVAGDRTGGVSLVAPGVISGAQARGTLRSVVTGRSVRGIPCWPEMSTSDRKNSARDWGFECGWTTEEVLDDLVRGARGRALGRDGAAEVPGRLPLPIERAPRGRPPADDTVLNSVSLPSIAAELDDRVDPRFAVFDANRTIETFPEPLTPLSIDVHSAGLRAADRVIGRLIGLHGPLAREWEVRAHAVFGHRVYAGVSAAVAVAPVVPGWSEKTVVARAFAGEGPGEIELHHEDRPGLPTGPRRLVARVGARYRFLGVLRRYRSSVRQFAVTSAGEHVDDAFLAGLGDAALDARARLLRDRISQGWVLCGLGELVERAMGTPLRLRARGEVAVLARGADAAGEPVFAQAGALASALAADARLRAAAEAGDLDAVRERFPEFAGALAEALERIGHRGPGETELSGATFAERPELLLAIAVGMSREAPRTPEAATSEEPPAREEPAAPPAGESTAYGLAGAWFSQGTGDATAQSADPPADPPTEKWAEDPMDEQAKPVEETPAEEPEESTVDKPVKVRRGIAGKLAAAGRRHHAVALDATLRYTDELRRLAWEWGRRQVAANRLIHADDVFHLTLDELLVPPADALARIERRRSELERLRGVRLPATVNGSWHPAAEPEPPADGERLTGTGASPGVVEGRVRVVTATLETRAEEGEILVVRVAGPWHTAMVATAAGVVTDVGDVLSGAAVVAREIGVPCVVGTGDASVRLTTGTTVRIDGDAGTVEVLAPSPIPHDDSLFAHH